MMEHDRDRMKRSPLACCRLNHVISSLAFVVSTGSLCSNQSRAEQAIKYKQRSILHDCIFITRLIEYIESSSIDSICATMLKKKEKKDDLTKS